MENEEKIVLEAIGKKIVEKRKQMNLTQDELAFSAEIDRTYIGYIESGRQNVSIAVLCKIANALQMKIKDFFE